LLELVGSAKALAAAGVGVTGGGAAGVAGLPCARFLGGVAGARASSWRLATLRFRLVVFDVVLVGISAFVAAMVLMREERLVTAMM
jgi:hypothetical protein